MLRRVFLGEERRGAERVPGSQASAQNRGKPATERADGLEVFIQDGRGRLLCRGWLDKRDALN